MRQSTVTTLQSFSKTTGPEAARHGRRRRRRGRPHCRRLRGGGVVDVLELTEVSLFVAAEFPGRGKTGQAN